MLSDIFPQSSENTINTPIISYKIDFFRIKIMLGFKRKAKAGTQPLLSKWSFNTRNHYKIWFSNNPDEFLDVENKFRLIQLIAENPHINLTFIYSSQSLNESGMADLNSFCSAFKIAPIDFSTGVLDFLVDPNDIALYHLANEEIERTLKNEGGNFAAASDIIRLIKRIISKFGMYNDFERLLNIEIYDPIHQCDAPIILNYDMAKDEMNNDTIAVAIDAENPLQLDPEAIRMIENAQKKLLSNYRKGEAKKLINQSPFPEHCCIFSTIVIKEYFRKNTNATIFDLRKFIQEVDFLGIMELLSDQGYNYYIKASRNTLSESKMKFNMGKTLLNGSEHYKGVKNPIEVADKAIANIKNNMQKISVVPFSGPDIMFAFFQDEFRSHLYNCELEKNLKEMFVENAPLNHFKNDPLYDLSWTPGGAKSKRERSEYILRNILTIQKTCRRFLRKIRIKKRDFYSEDSVSEGSQLIQDVMTEAPKIATVTLLAVEEPAAIIPGYQAANAKKRPLEEELEEKQKPRPEKRHKRESSWCAIL